MKRKKHKKANSMLHTPTESVACDGGCRRLCYREPHTSGVTRAREKVIYITSLLGPAIQLSDCMPGTHCPRFLRGVSWLVLAASDEEASYTMTVSSHELTVGQT